MRPKSALVTGASRRIGKAIALNLADAGFDVAVTARTMAAGDPVGDHSVSIHRSNDKPLPGSLKVTAEQIRALGAGTYVTITSGAGYDWYPPNPPSKAGVGLGYRMGKAAGHTLVGSILAEHGDAGIRAFNVDPGPIMTERNGADLSGAGEFDLSALAPPEVLGAVVTWLVTNREAESLQRTNLDAQELALERNLYLDWRPFRHQGDMSVSVEQRSNRGPYGVCSAVKTKGG